jgi:hypothetical protein
MEWRHGVLPRFWCPACCEDRLALMHMWELLPTGINQVYGWFCRTEGCRFSSIDYCEKR